MSAVDDPLYFVVYGSIIDQKLRQLKLVIASFFDCQLHKTSCCVYFKLGVWCQLLIVPNNLLCVGQ